MSLGARFVIFNAAGLAGLVVQLALLVALTRAGVHPLAANVIAIASVGLLKFWVVDAVVFRKLATAVNHQKLRVPDVPLLPGLPVTTDVARAAANCNTPPGLSQ